MVGIVEKLEETSDVIYHIYYKGTLMKRTTIFAEDDLLIELKELSKEEGKSVAELVREALERLIKSRTSPKAKKISFMGAGKSGKKNISARHEELLWKKPSKGR